MFSDTAPPVLLFYGEGLKLNLKLKFRHNQAHKITKLLSELAEVVAQEKLLLEEFYNLFRTMCVLEVSKYYLFHTSWFFVVTFFILFFSLFMVSLF